MTPDPYFFIIIFCGVALVFPLDAAGAGVALAAFFQPPKPGPAKNATYECGVESIGEAQVQFQSHYYLYCIIFLIFDVEAIFSCRLRWRLPVCRWARSSRSWFFCCCCSKDWSGRGAKGV